MKAEQERISRLNCSISRRVFGHSLMLAAAVSVIAGKLPFSYRALIDAAHSEPEFVVVNGWVLRADDLPENARVTGVI